MTLEFQERRPTDTNAWRPCQPRFETAVETAKATAGEVTSAHMLRVADELKATRDQRSTLEKASRYREREPR